MFAAKNEAILASAKAASAGNYDMAKAMAAAAAPAVPRFCPECGVPAKSGFKGELRALCNGTEDYSAIFPLLMCF